MQALYPQDITTHCGYNDSIYEREAIQIYCTYINPVSMII